MIVTVTAIVLSKALSCDFELIYEINMLLGEDVAEIVVADIDHDLLHATCVHRAVMNGCQLGSLFGGVCDDHADVHVVGAVHAEIFGMALDLGC